MTLLGGRVALVTGGARGIGRALGQALAVSGSRVALADLDGAAALAAAASLPTPGGGHLGLALDVTRPSEVRGGVEAVEGELGPIEILVNNAGVFLARPAEDLAEEEWDRVLDVNLKGMFLVAQAVGKKMVGRGRGVIVNLSSIYGARAVKGHLAYAVSKAGVAHLTRCLALEWGDRGVRVNALAPGVIDTPMLQAQLAAGAPIGPVVNRIPLGRIGAPEDLAGITVFLASDAARYVTGEVIGIDGGWHLA